MHRSCLLGEPLFTFVCKKLDMLAKLLCVCVVVGLSDDKTQELLLILCCITMLYALIWPACEWNSLWTSSIQARYDFFVVGTALYIGKEADL